MLCVVGEKIRFLDIDTVTVYEGPPGLGNTVMNAVTFNPSGDTVVAAGAEGTLRVLDMEQKKLMNVPWQGYTAPYRPNINALAYSPSGKLLAAGTASGQVAVMDALTYRLHVTVCWRYTAPYRP